MTTILFMTMLFLAASHEEMGQMLADPNFKCMQLSVLKNGKMVCEQCERCPAGMEPYPRCFTREIWIDGTFVKDCHRCRKGFFKETEKPSSAPCLPCDSVQCPPFHKVKQKCTLTSKPVCSDECIKGYIKERTDQCIPECCECVSASEKRVKQCQHTQNRHCAPVNGTCQNAHDIKTSSKTEPDRAPLSHSPTTDPKRNDVAPKNEGMTQKVNHQHSSIRAKPTTLDAHSQTPTSSHFSNKETAVKASSQSTQLTKPLSQQSPASVPLRSVKPKRKKRLKTMQKVSPNTAMNLLSANPIKTQGVTQSSPTTILSTTTTTPNSTMLPANKKVVGNTVTIIAVIVAIALVGLGISLHGYIKCFRLRQLPEVKNSSGSADLILELSAAEDKRVKLERSSSCHEETSGTSGTRSRRRSASCLSSTSSYKDLDQATSQTEELQSLLAKKPSLGVIHEPTYPTIQDTLAVTTCFVCGKQADKLLSEVTQVRLKFGDMAGFMDKQACDDVFWFLFENDCRYTGIDKPIDLFDVLIQRLPDITVANFFEILRITKKEGVARRFHADLHQVTCEDNKDR